MQEPTEGEMIRALGTKVDLLTETINRLNATMGGYVTQERYEADGRLAQLQHDEMVKDVSALEEKIKTINRAAWTLVVSPVIVGFIVWFLTTGVAR